MLYYLQKWNTLPHTIFVWKINSHMVLVVKFTCTGFPQIADFGLSNLYHKDKLLQTFCGSPLYASPEIVNGRPYRGPEVRPSEPNSDDDHGCVYELTWFNFCLSIIIVFAPFSSKRLIGFIFSFFDGITTGVQSRGGPFCTSKVGQLKYCLRPSPVLPWRVSFEVRNWRMSTPPPPIPTFSSA